MNGKLISFEGIECSGKGTQVALLKEYLSKKRIRYIASREPGGTSYGEVLRALLKNPKEAMQAIFQALKDNTDYPSFKNLLSAMREDNFDLKRMGETELFMYMASRSEYSGKVILPALQRGTWFISDRLYDSTVAYQGGGHFNGDPKKIAEIDAMNRIAMRGIVPNLTLYLDVPVEIMFERMYKQAPDKNSYFEKTYSRGFFAKTRDEYLRIAEREPNRFKVVDGTASVEEVTTEINKLVDALVA